ncbi:MAG: hypothetical protein O7B25_07955 [Gammaproteobacteria bacterium]|nr:hypothetical protein [Gammaproteobacteria bacterium]
MCGLLMLCMLGAASAVRAQASDAGSPAAEFVAEDEQHVGPAFPPAMRCEAEQTGGFHDYPDGGVRYEPAVFHPASFVLEADGLSTVNVEPGRGDPYLHLIMRAADDVELELQCRRVRGADRAWGYSCANTPPSEMLLINNQTLRFTRTLFGDWTFPGARESMSGDSISVEYGTCALVVADPRS